MLVLTFSGGGTRAAAFSYGVLEELARTEITEGGHRHRLLDEVDLISSVSGGSFTAAYYGLFGDKIFEDFEKQFLKKNIQGALIARLLSPLKWLKLVSPSFDRSDLAAEYYDRHLFAGGTFSDIEKRNGPFILINATDMTLGTWFSFSQDYFDWICSDVSKISVARAVAASSAVPVIFTPLTLRNYSGSCGYRTPDWVIEAMSQREVSARRFNQAVHTASYLDAEKKPYIHLLDGGLSDNLGLRAAIDKVILVGNIGRALHEVGRENTRKIVFIIVNAETEPDILWDKFERPPALTQMLISATTATVNRYNFETVELLRGYLRKWAVDIRRQRCGDQDRKNNDVETISGPGSCEDITFYLVEVNFDALKDGEERARLKGLSSSLGLPSETVDRLREAAHKILSESAEFQRLLLDLRNRRHHGSDTD